MQTKVDIKTPAIAAFGVALFLGFPLALEYPPSATARDDLRKLYPGQGIAIHALHVANLEEACGEYQVSHQAISRRFLTMRKGSWVDTQPADWRARIQVGLYSLSLNDAWESCKNTTGRGHAVDFITIPILIALLNST